MIIPLIYIFGRGVFDFDISSLVRILISKYNLVDVSGKSDEEVYLSGEKVSEIVLSKDLHSIKIDSDEDVFLDILFDVLICLREVEGYVYCFGLSPDEGDYKKLPLINNREDLSQFNI